jgi:hypothetical protein
MNARPDDVLARLEARLEEVEDRQKVYDVLARYCRALDRCDLELMKTVYWEDGIDDHGVFSGNAQEFAEFIIREIREWFELTMHAICNVMIELDGDTAYTESYLISYCQVKADRARIEGVFGPTYLQRFVGSNEPAPQDFLYGGRYVDRLEKRHGTWRIAKRTVVMDWNRNEPSRDILDEGMFKALALRGTRDRTDAVYRARPGRPDTDRDRD